jgi:subtilisin family serine protease
MAVPLQSDVPTFQAPAGERLEFVPRQVVVRVHESALREAEDAANEPLELLAREAGTRNVEPLVEGMTLIEVEGDVSRDLLRRVEASPAIAFAEPVPARWPSAAEPADPRHNRQWGLRAIRWFDAPLPSAESVIVAVCDTGVDAAHPDLAEAISSYDHEGAGAADIVGHGTHVSGIIAARVNNDAGIAGVAACRIAMWKVFPDEPYQGNFYVDGTRFLRALNAVATSGAKVLNLSLGGTQASQAEQLLFDRLERAGVTVVAAMGNEYAGGNPTEYPAAYEHVLAVGAAAETDLRSPFSNTGKHIGLAAPGSDILSTLPTTASPYRPATNYASWSGTSMATPHVTAAAALVAAQHQQWRPADTKQHLRDTARRVADMGSARWTEAYGSGLLDVAAAQSA